MKNLCLFLCAPLLLVSTTLANEVWIVDSTGSGDFDNIQDAIDAAGSGDTIRLRHGDFHGFDIDGISLTILGAPWGGDIVGSVRITRLAQDQRVVLTRLSVKGPANGSFNQAALQIEDCAGAVHVRYCDFVGGTPEMLDYQSGGNSAARIRNSSQVSISNTWFFGGDSKCFPPGAGQPNGVAEDGKPGVLIIASSVALNDCRVYAGLGGDAGCLDGSAGADGGRGGHGIRIVDDSFVFIAGTVTEGGTGGSGLSCSGGTLIAGDGGNGGDSLRAGPGSVLRDRASTFNAGLGGYKGNGQACGVVTSHGEHGEELQVSAADYQELSDEWAVLEGSPISLCDKQFVVRVRGDAGVNCFLAYGEGSGFQYDATVEGVWIPELPLVNTMIPLGTIPADGRLNKTIELPIAPGTGATNHVAQLYTIDAGNQARLGAPTVFTFVGPNAATPYCVAAPNSLGGTPMLSAQGSCSVLENNLRLQCVELPPNRLTHIFYGGTQVQQPFGDGYRCVGGPVFRLDDALISSSMGTTMQAIDFFAAPMDSGPGAVVPGSTWNFQLWYRDPDAGGTGFNLSNGLSIQFAP